MRRTAIALSAAGVLAVAGAMLVLRGHLVPELEPATGQAAVADETAGASQLPRPAEELAKQARVRPVAPEVVAQPQVAPEELQRVAPRAALSRFGQPLPPRRRNHGRIFRPLITEAGRVNGSGITVTIAGIEITPADETCMDADGQSWSCGIRARTAFRAFVRGRALACDLPEELEEKHYTAACSLGKQDVGAWLVERGWVRALAGGPYEQAQETARADGRGIFGSAPVLQAAEELPGPDIAAPVDSSPLFLD
jgi:endonuclease YncB( thermonuclease family)